MPAPPQQSELAAYQSKWTWPAGSVVTQPERLHLTLQFLGDVDVHRERALKTWLREIKLSHFDLLFGKGGLYDGGHAVVTPSSSEALIELQEKVQAVAAWCGISSEARQWAPHVTLARSASGATVPSKPLWLRWPIRSFSLVASRNGAYEIVSSWPQDAVACQ